MHRPRVTSALSVPPLGCSGGGLQDGPSPLGLDCDGLHSVRASCVLFWNLSHSIHYPRGSNRGSRHTPHVLSIAAGPGVSNVSKNLRDEPLFISTRPHVADSPTVLPPGLDLVPTSRHSYWRLKVSYHFKCSSTFFKAPCCFMGPSWPSAHHLYIHTGETGRLGRHCPLIKGFPLLIWD